MKIEPCATPQARQAMRNRIAEVIPLKYQKSEVTDYRIGQLSEFLETGYLVRIQRTAPSKWAFSVFKP